MPMNPKKSLILGFDLDKWHKYGIREPVSIDISPGINSHTILSGMSGGGKSFLEFQILARLGQGEPDGEFYFADYKQDDSFSCLRECPRYYKYKDTLQALDIVYRRLQAHQSGEDTSRNPVTLIWDEYMAQVLSLISEDKKAANTVMGKVSEILMLGRSLGPIRLITSCQRPDALAFPAGSRQNYGCAIIVGSYIRSIYEMLMPDFIDEIKERKFERGEGAVLLQGSELRFIKVPMVRNEERMRQICIRALGEPAEKGSRHSSNEV